MIRYTKVVSGSLLPVCWLCSGCVSAGFPVSMVADAAMVPAGGKIEIAVDAVGKLEEVEFHIAEGDLPAEVVRVVNDKFPGGTIVGAEKEYDRGRLFHEVTKDIDGRRFEVMVTPDGRIHLMEIVIAKTDAPPTVLDAADGAVPGGTLTQVEKILDGDDHLVEYHVKKTVDGKHYKILIAPDGALIRALREIPAEVEVPIN